MSQFYEAGSFWQDVLAERFDLTGVGHGGYGARYNAVLYRAKLRAFERALRASGVELQGRSVADVGCGTGFFTEQATRRGCSSYAGFDITPVAVTALSERFPQHGFHLADIGGELPDAGTFDVVLCFDVLYHVVDSQRFERAVSNLLRLVAPGGHLLLVDAFDREDVVPGPTLDVPHVVFHKRRDYDRLLFSRARLVSMTPMYWLLNRPVRAARWPWTNRRLSWHIRRWVIESRLVLPVLYAVDAVVTRVRRSGADLKIAVVRKESA